MKHVVGAWTVVMAGVFLVSSCVTPTKNWEEHIDYDTPSKYLQNGQDTKITDEQWEEVRPQISEADFLDVLSSVYEWKDQNFQKASRERGQIGIPSAAELIREGKLYGCHDDGAVMAAVMRRSGYPVVMLETVSIEWAQEYRRRDTTSGHIFLEVYTGDRWVLVDSTKRRLALNYDPHNPAIPMSYPPQDQLGYYVLYKGIDAADYGVRDLVVLGERMKRFAARTDLSSVEMPEYEVKHLR